VRTLESNVTVVMIGRERVDRDRLLTIGHGGEADVYDLGDGRALKLYKPIDHPDFGGDPALAHAVATRLAQIEAKLADFPRRLPPSVVAPVELARSPHGAVIGYTMAKVAGTPMLWFGEPRHRRTHAIDLPQLLAGLRHLHGSVDAIHAAGVVIGDFNDANVLVEGACCHLIDADSLQFGAWRCAMFTDRYVDPRLCDRTAPTPQLIAPHDVDSDWFAFTAMVFRALAWVSPFGGVHQPRDPSQRVAPAARVLRGPRVFAADVVYPRSSAPLTGLADSLAGYFRAVFDRGVRGRFPIELLHQVTLTRCATCGVDHGRSRCPTCQQLVPAVRITRAITARAIDPRTLTRATRPVGANPADGVWLAGSSVMSAGRLGPEVIGHVVAGASHLWIGAAMGAGWWRVGGYAIGFTWALGRRGIDDRARLPAIPGQILAAGCAVAERRAWLWWRIAIGSRERYLLCCIGDGALLATTEGDASDGDWMVGLAGACAAGPYLFVPTDLGIVRVEVDAGVARVTRRFDDTAPLCAAADDLFVTASGLAIAKVGAALNLPSGPARAVALTFTTRGP
jgi:hypothetical protein